MTISKSDLELIAGVIDKSIQPLRDDIHEVRDRLEVVEDRLDKVEDDIRTIKVVHLENNIIPRLTLMEDSYLDASHRYIDKSQQFENAIADIDVIKKTVKKHSEEIQELQLKQA